MDKNLKIIESEDGSHTLFNHALNETYHSTHGAYTESMHVFIQNGITRFNRKNIAVFEVGFGTGLNALLTLKYLKEQDQIESIHYHTIELYPLEDEITEALNYIKDLPDVEMQWFQEMHNSPWEQEVKITDGFTLHKHQADIVTFEPHMAIDVVYFDAFGPDVQPQLWTPAIFEKLHRQMSVGGVFSTYSAKGQVRRDLQGVGFKVERCPGPPGKREMLVATKTEL